MIEERRCSYEVAKLLKEKDFDIGCNGTYSTRSKEFHFDATRKCENHGLFIIAATTHQMACDWLYEKYGIFITTDVYLDELDGSKYITWKIYVCTGDVKCVQGRNDKITDIHNVFESALKYSLENLV